jgi:hypothetical protein
MATYNKGVIYLLGDVGVEGEPVRKTRIDGVTDLAALNTLGTALIWSDPNGFSDCALAKVSFSTMDDKGASKPGASVDVDEAAVIVTRKTSDGSIHKHSIAAPNAAVFTLESVGKRMTAAKVAEWATALSTATGDTYVGLYGYKVERK